MFAIVYSDQEGNVTTEPELEFLGRAGSNWIEAESGDLIELPAGSSLVMMPGHFPVGFNPKNQQSEYLGPEGSRTPVALACLLPQGFTRTLLPATASPQPGALPILGYCAVATRGGKLYAAAIQTDRHHKWHPRYYNTEGLENRIKRKLKKYPDNRLLAQLAHCGLNYSCFTAQNIFYERWEAGIPVSPACNAACLGCISLSHAGVPSPQSRLAIVPDVREIFELGLEHLNRAREGIISFGQGCEGEPALQADRIAEAIYRMRAETDRGSININTNAGCTEGIKKIVDAGLDSIRVTIISACEADYNLYHKPRGFKLKDVITSIKYAHDHGVYVSLNLLTMPGYTDDEKQVEQLIRLCREAGVNMVQLRNLNLDPDLFFANLQPGSNTLGIRNMVAWLEAAGLKVASYTHPARRVTGGRQAV